jgi:hypothetical protein
VSLAALTRVWETSKQDGSTLLLLLAMADFANEYGMCWASIDTLAKKARISRRSVIDHCQKLLGAGEILFDGTTKRGTNRYLVVGGADFALVPEDAEEAIDAPPMPGGSAESAPVQNGGAGLHPIRKELSTPYIGGTTKDHYGSGADCAPPSARDQTPWVLALAAIRCDRFAKRTPGDNFERYFQPTVAVGLTDGRFRVACEDEDQRAWLQSNGRAVAENALVGVLGKRIEIEFVVEEKP